MASFKQELAKVVPLPWQGPGVEWMLDRTRGMLFDEPGMGKSKQLVDWGCQKHYDGRLATVLIVAPAYIQSEWDDLQTGHLSIMAWENMDHLLHRLNGSAMAFDFAAKDKLLWLITSYDFLRNPRALPSFVRQVGARGRWAVALDECSAMANRTTKRTKATKKLTSFADYAWGMNGTPLANSVTDLWSQFDVVCPQANVEARTKSWYSFRDAHAKLGGYMGKQVVGIRDEERLWDAYRDWVLLRKAEDHLDLAQPVRKILPVAMSTEAWKLYQTMRDDMVVHLNQETSTAQSAGVKAVRLLQLCSGFLGGMEGFDCITCGLDKTEHPHDDCEMFLPEILPPRFIDYNKIDAVKQWMEGKECGVIWCRFRHQAMAVYDHLLPKHRVGLLIGQQGLAEKYRCNRDTVKVQFKQGEIDWLVATPDAAAMGLNLQRAHDAAYLANGGSWLKREQSERRMIRIGQKHPVVIFDFVATSPNGKQTLDWHARQILMRKEHLSNLSKEAWKTVVRSL